MERGLCRMNPCLFAPVGKQEIYGEEKNKKEAVFGI